MKIRFVSRHSYESRNPGFPMKTEIHLLNNVYFRKILLDSRLRRNDRFMRFGQSSFKIFSATSAHSLGHAFVASARTDAVASM